MSALLRLQDLIVAARSFHLTTAAATPAEASGVRTYAGMIDWCLDNARHQGWLVEGLLPSRSLALLAGVSGLGKSPLLYQLCLCVAAGVPFLGRPTGRGRVVYMDCENSVPQVVDIIARLSNFLELPDVPSDLLFWNRNALRTRFDAGTDMPKLLDATQPSLVILDPVSSLYRSAEFEAQQANEMFDTLRAYAATYGCAFLLVHHLRKNATKQDERRSWLETTDNVGEWLESARGTLALLNGTDVRIGVDWPADQAERHRRDPALVLRGFMRFEGTLPPIRVTRTHDTSGRPQGYKLKTEVSEPQQRSLRLK